MTETFRHSTGNDLETVEVSCLLNANAFGYDAVAIVDKGNQYRLVVLNIGDFGDILFSEAYEKLATARAEFIRRFAAAETDIKQEVEPHWTPFYYSFDELDYFTLYMLNQRRIRQ